MATSAILKAWRDAYASSSQGWPTISHNAGTAIRDRHQSPRFSGHYPVYLCADLPDVSGNGDGGELKYRGSGFSDRQRRSIMRSPSGEGAVGAVRGWPHRARMRGPLFRHGCRPTAASIARQHPLPHRLTRWPRSGPSPANIGVVVHIAPQGCCRKWALLAAIFVILKAWHDAYGLSSRGWPTT